MTQSTKTGSPPALAAFGEGLLRLSPPTGERLETADSLDCRVGGAESNVAVAAARLGLDATWLSKLPDTPLGDRVVSELRRHGVDPRVVRGAGRQGTYYLEAGEEPRGVSVIYDREQTAIRTVERAALDTGAIEQSDCFVTTGITPALSDSLAQTVESLLELAEYTAFDLNYRETLWSASRAKESYERLLPAVDLLFAPARDLRSVLGLTGTADEMAGTLREQYGCETVVVTRGADGAVAATERGIHEQEAFTAETVDRIGTGDAFVGGYLSQALRGETVGRSLEYGAAAAALKRTIAGDMAVISEADIENVLGDQGGIDR